ncbi:flagellin [Azospirillum sp.]|uniref:flagellin n=1 Tax=Azospirillum sp. TaxID=34012 RepID=UPI003D725682
MANSVNTNQSSLVALQSLNNTVNALNKTQKRVTTGYKVADAVDDGAAFAVAQSLRSEKGAIDAVNSQLNIAKGATNVFNNAATNVSDALARARETLTKLADQNLNTDMRSKYNNDFTALKAEVQNYISNAKFNGINLLSGAQTNISVIANADGTQYTVGGTGVSLSSTIVSAFTSVGSAASAVVLLTGAFASAEKSTGDVLNTLGADSRRLDAQIKFNASMQDALTTSLGAIVDADLAKESATLQAQQIKQQLGAQTLGIANQAPQILQNLFRG